MPTPLKIHCTVSDIIPHGNKVYTIELTPPGGSFPRFNCGQFLHLTLDEYDPSGFWPESRVFSIASSPADRTQLKIIFSVKGKYTTRMENELTVGKEVWIKMPYGEFYVDPSQPVVLVAGGTGITAFTAFLENTAKTISTPLGVFYGAKQRQLLLYKAFLDQSRQENANLNVHYFIEDVDQLQPQETQGHITLDEVWNRLDKPISNEFYLSGPPIMLKNFSQELEERGLPLTQIHIDAWE